MSDVDKRIEKEAYDVIDYDNSGMSTEEIKEAEKIRKEHLDNLLSETVEKDIKERENYQGTLEKIKEKVSDMEQGINSQADQLKVVEDQKNELFEEFSKIENPTDEQLAEMRADLAVLNEKQKNLSDNMTDIINSYKDVGPEVDEPLFDMDDYMGANRKKEENND